MKALLPSAMGNYSDFRGRGRSHARCDAPRWPRRPLAGNPLRSIRGRPAPRDTNEAHESRDAPPRRADSGRIRSRKADPRDRREFGRSSGLRAGTEHPGEPAMRTDDVRRQPRMSREKLK